jgi:hypothetical protein
LFSAVILQIWRGGSRMMLYFFPSRNHQGWRLTYTEDK